MIRNEHAQNKTDVCCPQKIAVARAVSYDDL